MMNLFSNKEKRGIGYSLKGVKNSSVFLFFLLTCVSQGWGQTPVGANGALSVSGVNLVNSSGTPVQLRGMSTHGLQWYASCINFDAVSAMVSDWGIDILRLAMYVEEDGYVKDPEYYKGYIDQLVDLTEHFGIYCLIDWHVHKPGDPWNNIKEARDFWKYMSSKHAGKDHVLYEICNEPNGVNWARVKSYAEDIIPIIRANDPSSVIIVGTPNWSQDVDIASQDPLNFKNIMYTLHFYSGTHGKSLRDKADKAISKGVALFVTEWGTSQASGDGGPYLSPQSDDWIAWINSKKLSWCNWSYADKKEVSAALLPGSCFGSNWNNTSKSGAYVKKKLLNPADAWAKGENIPPVASVISPTSGAKFELNKTFTIEASASDQDGTVTLVEFYANGSKIGEDASSPYSMNYAANKIGDLKLSVKVTDNKGATNKSLTVSVKILKEIIQLAYPDSIPHAVPGDINATYFDIGGEGIAYHDADATNKGGYNRKNEGVDTESSEGGNIGYVVNDEWLEYTINVAKTGTYSLDLKVASKPGGGKFHVEFNGKDATGVINVPKTGSWTAYKKLTISNISLSAGKQVMRFAIDVGDFNFAAFSFKNTGTGPVPPNAIVSANPTSGKAPLSVAFDGSGSSDSDGTITEYKWDFGDNSTGSGAKISHTYSSIGTYKVVLTVKDNDGKTDQATVNINVTDSTTTYYTVNTTVSGKGSVSISPSGGSYAAGTEVTITATAATGYKFDSWSGDVSNKVNPLVIKVNSNLNIKANFISTGDPCDSETPISMPFSQDGAGEYCFVAKGKLSYINSWNMKLVEVNGQDFTNKWSDKIPAAADGKIHIRYVALVNWAHFEIKGNDNSMQDVPVTGVSVKPTSDSIKVGETTSLSVTIAPSNATDQTVSWSSSNTSVATVNNSGVVTVIAKGTATITVTTNSGGFTASAKITVTQGNSTVTCDNPVAISTPYSQDGIGEYCWVTKDDIAYINSWNMSVVKINGVNFTNEWSDKIPAKQNGNYYIYCKGEHKWSQLEISGTKDAGISNSITNVKVFPNPFTESASLIIINPELINSVQVFDQVGKLVVKYNTTDIQPNMRIGRGLERGIYWIKVTYNAGEQTIMISKH